MDRASKIFYALLALFALALAVGGLAGAGGEGLVFGLFAFLTIGGGFVCIFERSVVRSAFALLATFSGTAGLFLLLGSDFLAMAQVLIYVGGVLALVWMGCQVRSSVVGATAAKLPPLESNARRIGVGFLSARQYVVPFELAAVVLTVALVAAVYIARRRKSDLVPEPGEDAAVP